MAHGTRGRWVRVATTGFAVLLCTGLVGCMNSDKKDTKLVNQPGPGLPNTTRLGPDGRPIAKAGMPAPHAGGVQQAGGFGQTRYDTTGRNTNTGGTAPQPYYSNNVNTPGQPGQITAPVQQGIVPNVGPAAIQPAGGMPLGHNGVNTNPNGYTNPIASAGSGPLPPSLNDMPLPPPPPGQVTSGTGFAAVQPPVNQFAPVAPTMPPSNPQALSFSTGGFGGK